MLAVAAVAATVAAGSGMVAAQGGHGLLGLEGPFDIAVDLRGHKVVPGPGDPNGRAALGLNTDTRRQRICWELRTTRLDPITGASLSRGGLDQAAAPQDRALRRRKPWGGCVPRLHRRRRSTDDPPDLEGAWP